VAGGLSAVVKTAGDSVAAMTVCESAGLQMGLGRPPVDRYGDKNKIWTRTGLAALRRGERGEVEPDLRLEPFARLLRREYPARMRVATSEDVWAALRLADEFGFDWCWSS